MAERRDTVTVTIEELMPLIKNYIRSTCPDIKYDDILEYSSKTRYLLFDVVRPGKKE